MGMVRGQVMVGDPFVSCLFRSPCPQLPAHLKTFATVRWRREKTNLGYEGVECVLTPHAHREATANLAISLEDYVIRSETALLAAMLTALVAVDKLQPWLLPAV